MSRYELLHGACLERLKQLDDCSVDAVVTDPPYGLEFMGKDWDAPWKHTIAETGYTDGAERLARPSFTSSRNPICLSCGKRQRTWKGGPATCECSAPKWDRKQSDEMRVFQDWCELWAAECLRVLKPGGHLLAFGGTRTYHRMTCAIEDAGFEIRDSIHWVYGSGFPKSLDVSKAIDKAAGAERPVIGEWRPTGNARIVGGQGSSTAGLGATAYEGATLRDTLPITAPATDEAKTWQGWGTALKPAHEPIVVARKPLVGMVAANVLAHGVGGINVDGCRVGDTGGTRRDGKADQPNASGWENMRGHGIAELNAGRWPANILFSHLPECDENTCAKGCAVAELDAQSGTRTSGKPGGSMRQQRGTFSANATDTPLTGYGDAGGASRFFPAFRYQSKASRRDRGEGNNHPTVKPVALMRWLVRLVTPRGGLVLDPFTGSGTTGVAALLEGFRFIGCEREAEYLTIAQARIAAAEAATLTQQPALFDLTEVA